MLTCREVLDSLSSYLDKELVQEVQVEMERHIGKCSDCRAEFDTLTMTVKLYQHVETPPVLPTGCHDRLVKTLELEKMKKRPPEAKA